MGVGEACLNLSHFAQCESAANLFSLRISPNDTDMAVQCDLPGYPCAMLGVASLSSVLSVIHLLPAALGLGGGVGMSYHWLFCGHLTCDHTGQGQQVWGTWP
jgi:hypothetical protein